MIGPVKRTSITNDILEAFNAVNDQIQFTIEMPEDNATIDFLDIEMKIKDSSIEYQWHVKPCHSNNSLNKNSWVPNSIKTTLATRSTLSVKDALT